MPKPKNKARSRNRRLRKGADEWRKTQKWMEENRREAEEAGRGIIEVRKGEPDFSSPRSPFLFPTI
jgi:hypothetical protein